MLEIFESFESFESEETMEGSDSTCESTHDVTSPNSAFEDLDEGLDDESFNIESVNAERNSDSVHDVTDTFSAFEEMEDEDDENCSFDDTSEDIENNENQSEIEVSEPRKIKTINDDYAGQMHPETGVPYVEKIVETDTGEKVKGVFPQLESTFDVQLPDDLLNATDGKQFKECNQQLKEKCDNDPEYKNQFNERQRENIDDGNTPYGFTWHHNEELGKMQLVDYDTHANTRHTGGKCIWGGGSENR